MFKNLSTSTKLLILCGAFTFSVGIPVYALVAEKWIAIAFARKELAGSHYLATIRDIYEEIVAVRLSATPGNRRAASREAILKDLDHAEAKADGQLQTGELARALGEALRNLWPDDALISRRDDRVLGALAHAQTLAARIGDDSNLALDPDLDSYYVQTMVVHKLPTFIGRLVELQEVFETTVASGSVVREARLPVLMSLVRASATELQDSLNAAYRGNQDGRLKVAVGAELTTLNSTMNSYFGALYASMSGIDSRDAVAYDRFHASTLHAAIAAWKGAQVQLDRLLQQRIDNLFGKMWLWLALIGAFAALSFIVAALTHRHIVRPLKRLETVASTSARCQRL